MCTGDKIKLNSDQIITNRTAVFLCRKNTSLDDYYYCAYLVELARILKIAAFTFTDIPQGINCVKTGSTEGVFICGNHRQNAAKNVR